MAGIFKAYDIRGVYGEQLDRHTAYWIGVGLAVKLFGQDGKVIVVSRDARSHSEEACQALIQGLNEAGCNVIDMGLAATPMNYWANVEYKADASVMVTASHNPAKYNGFKVSMANALPMDHAGGLDQVESFVSEHLSQESYQGPSKGTILKTLDTPEVLEQYLDFMDQFMPKIQDPKTLKIAIDAANGMAGLFLEAFCKRYPWIETVPLYWELDGSFPNHEADPQKVANLKDLQQAVKQNNCDWGVAFDGDGDRAVFVDEQAQPIASDLMTALIAQKYLQEKPGTAILYDLRSSAVVPESILQAGGKPVRSRVGHSFMKRLLKSEDASFGGELSGHYYFADCFDTDSALMAMIQIIGIWQQSQSPLSELIDGFRKYHPTGEISSRVSDAQAIIQQLQTHFANLKQDHLDGLTVEGDGWWFNLRSSNTEPLLRLNLEAESPALRDEKLQEIQAFIK